MKYIVSKDSADIMTLEGDVAIREDVPVPPPPPPPPPIVIRTITISPTSGVRGTPVTITGTGWGAYEHFIIYEDDFRYTTYQAGLDGTFTITLTMPPPADPRLPARIKAFLWKATHRGWPRKMLRTSLVIMVVPAGQTTGPSAVFTITAPTPPQPPVSTSSINLNPTSGKAGDTVTLTGSGFPASTMVAVYVSQLYHSYTTSDATGALSTNITMKSSELAGQTSVRVDAFLRGTPTPAASAVFTVTG